jgi:spore coat polysaccharide biosynthesis predicted glycosyltransferase SpsG
MNLTKKKILIITVSLEETGRGHFVRSKNLYHFFKKKHLVNVVTIDKKILKTKFNSTFLNKLNTLLKSNKIIILDFSNYLFFKKNFFINLFRLLKKFESKIVIIDSLNKDSILNYYNFLNPIMIYPYIMNKKSLFSLKYFNKTKKYLIGPKYFILNKNNNVKIDKRMIKKILVSCGGSDKENCTLKVIKFFSKYRNIFSLSCVMGPFFNKVSICKIKNFIKSNRLKKNVKLLFNIKNLTSIFINFGTVISTSGLTKYEAAAYGIPNIVITPNKYQLKHNFDFAKKKICLSIKSNDFVKKEKNIISFLNNFVLQKKMSKRSKNLIDFKGSERIEKILISNFK